MKYKALRLSLGLLMWIVIASGGSASAKEVCKVADPTGATLNVRDTPNGKVINALKNGRVIEILDSGSDAQKRSWVKVGGSYQGKYRVWGWVIYQSIKCERELFIPSNSTLHSPVKSKGAGIRAELQGKLWVPGTLMMRWVPSGESAQNSMELWLIPDDQAILPRFDPYKSDIQILDGEQILPVAFGEAIAARISAQQEQTAQVRGRFLITDYKTGVVCDSGWTTAKLLNADVPKNRVSAFSHRDLLGGC